MEKGKGVDKRRGWKKVLESGQGWTASSTRAAENRMRRKGLS